jgi:hypothetical protein
MNSLANVVNLLADEFSGLRAGRLALALVASGALQCLTFWHERHSCSLSLQRL